MDIIIINILVILVGSICALFSAIITNFSLEQQNEVFNKLTKRAERLRTLKLEDEKANLAYNLFEMLLYVISCVMTGYVVHQLTEDFQYIFYSIIIIFVFIVLLRTFLHSIGKRYANYLAYHFANFLYVLYKIFKPFAYPIKLIKNKIGVEIVEDAAIEELNDLLETAHEEGSIESDEYRILKNIIHFSEVLVSDVMTPRTVIFSCEANLTVSEVLKYPEIKMYSRIPIWEGESLDDGILGYVMTKDILYSIISGKTSTKLKDLARNIEYIPENAQLDVALERFLQLQQHIFLVVDEYGGIEGLITMEDVIETILGVEIIDEADKVADLRELAKSLRNRRIQQLSSLSEILSENKENKS